METKTDLNAMYELMGERWAVVKVDVEDDETVNVYHITAHPKSFKGKVVVENLKYSQAQGIKKLLESGENNGNL